MLLIIFGSPVRRTLLMRVDNPQFTSITKEIPEFDLGEISNKFYFAKWKVSFLFSYLISEVNLFYGLITSHITCILLHCRQCIIVWCHQNDEILNI